MKRTLPTLISFFSVVLFSYILPVTLYAQTPEASPSAITPTLSELPAVLPTVTPSMQPTTSFRVLQKINELATPTPSTESATPVASSSASDYCLNVPIIMYHHVEPIEISSQLGHPQLTVDSNIFQEHIQYLVQHHYHFLSLETLVHAILDRKTVPDKSVVITLDDGYIDDYTYAFLMAKKYQVIMNFMIPTGLVGQPDYMTWDHLEELAVNPYARIYNHTTTHAPLGLISQDEIIKEVTTANKQLKDNLGIDNDIVVYPYGSYSDLAIQTLTQLGMIAGLSTDPGTNDCISNIMKLPRVRVGNEALSLYGY